MNPHERIKMKDNKVVSNVIWRLFERCSAQVITFIVTTILARILTPDDYGTLTLVLVFITILQVFVDSGMGAALIQKKNADNRIPLQFPYVGWPVPADGLGCSVDLGLLRQA